MRGKAIFFTLLILIILCALIVPTAQNAVMKMLYPVLYENEIAEQAKKNDLEPYLVLGLIKAESNFVSDATSHQGAKGLMQLTESTAQWAAKKMELDNFEVDNLSTPSVNIAIGCWYLRYLLDEYEGDITLALCAYNAGSGNVAKWLENEKYSSDGENLESIPFPETMSYVSNTQEYAEKYRKLYPDIFK